MAQKLFTIEVFYKHDAELKREVLRNITGQKLKEFRETFFTVGLAVADPAERILVNAVNAINAPAASAVVCNVFKGNSYMLRQVYRLGCDISKQSTTRAKQ